MTHYNFIAWLSRDPRDANIQPLALTGRVTAASEAKAYDVALMHIEKSMDDHPTYELINWYAWSLDKDKVTG